MVLSPQSISTARSDLFCAAWQQRRQGTRTGTISAVAFVNNFFRNCPLVSESHITTQPIVPLSAFRLPDPAARSHVRCVNEMPMGSTPTRQARPRNTANNSQTKSEKESSTTKTARANFSEIACVVFRDA